MNAKYTTVLKLIVIAFVISAVFALTPNAVYAAQCCDDPEECDDDEYQCEYGTYCCLQWGGCPSDECGNIDGCQYDDVNKWCERDSSCYGETYSDCVDIDHCYWSTMMGECLNGANCDTSMYECGPCSGCPTCDPSNPVVSQLVSPGSGSGCVTTSPVTLDWNAVTSWGTGCPSNTNSYDVYVNGALVANVGSGTTQYSYPVTMGNTYTWFVRAKNGSRTADYTAFTFTTGACAQIVGRVWSDNNGNGSYNCTTEQWSHNPPPGAGCSYSTDNDINMSWVGGGSVLEGWGCNGCGSYYHTYYYTLNGSPGSANATVNMQLTTPDLIDYPNRYASWSFNSLNASGNAINQVSGTSNIANSFTITDYYGMDWSNHMQWQIKLNTPPTGNVTLNPMPPSGQIGDTGSPYYLPMYVYPIGSNISFYVSSSDLPSNISNWQLALYRRAYDPVNRIAGDPLATIGSNSGCVGNSCSANFSTTVQSGYTIYYPNARDEISMQVGQRANNQCSGHPGVNGGTITGWADCDPVWVNGYNDEVIVLGVSPPTCAGVNGNTSLYSYPSTLPFKYPENIGFYSMNVTGTQGNEIKQTWSPTWSNPGNGSYFPAITQVKVFARGSSAAGVWPIMQVFTGDNATGNRTKQNMCRVSGGVCTIGVGADVSVNHTDFREYRIIASPLNNLSSLDVVFTNDYSGGGEDRNLYINSIEYTYEVAPGVTTTKLIYPYVGAGWGNANVYYDRGFGGGGYNRYEFDGRERLALINGSNQFPGDIWTFSAGTMSWSGSLNFPIPLRSSTVAQNASVIAVPTVNPPFLSGGTCQLSPIAIEDPYYNVDGTLYVRSNPSSCPGGVDEAIQNSTARVVDSLGNQIPNFGTYVFSDASDTNGDYAITHIPLGYKQNSLGCPNCGVRICIDQLAPDLGALALGCVNNGVYANQTLCSDVIPAQPAYPPASNVTMDMGFDKYNNQKWSSVVDGDFYAASVTFDVAETPEPTLFSPYVINTLNSNTIGGFGFVDGIVDLGAPLSKSNIAEGGGSVDQGGYALNLLRASPSYNFKDKWFDGYTVAAPSHPSVFTNVNVISGGVATFDSGHIYHYNSVTQFTNAFYTPGIVSYRVTGANNVVLVYVTDPSPTAQLTLNRKVRSEAANPNRGLVLITNLPVQITDTSPQMEVPETLLYPTPTYSVSAASFGSPVLTNGYLDFTVISTDEIEFTSKYDPAPDPVIHDLPIMIYGGLASSERIRFNRDLYHIYNSDFPSEMVRFNHTVLPTLTAAERNSTTVSSFTGLSQIDIQLPYE